MKVIFNLNMNDMVQAPCEHPSVRSFVHQGFRWSSACFHGN